MTTIEPAAGPSESPLLDLLTGFIVELRNAGLPVSLTENLDAMEAIQHIPLEDRTALKYALAATLVKNHTHWRAFEIVFDVYFSLRGDEYSIDESELMDDGRFDDDDEGDHANRGPGDGQGEGGGSNSGMTPEELAEMLYNALANGDAAMMRSMARESVRRYAGMEPGRPVGGTYYLYRTLRNLDLDGILEKLLQQQQDASDGEMSQFEERLARDEFNDRIDALKKEIEAEIRRRLVADRGVEAMAKTLRKPLPEDVDLRGL